MRGHSTTKRVPQQPLFDSEFCIPMITMLMLAFFVLLFVLICFIVIHKFKSFMSTEIYTDDIVLVYIIIIYSICLTMFKAYFMRFHFD